MPTAPWTDSGLSMAAMSYDNEPAENSIEGLRSGTKKDRIACQWKRGVNTFEKGSN